MASQKQMLEAYAAQHGFGNICHYTDDGWSGGSFDRPDWNRMIADIEAGKIGCVIAKDGCVNIELNSESPQKCGFCDVSSVF